MYRLYFKKLFLFGILSLSIFITNCSQKRNANTIPWKKCQPNSEITQEQITEGNLKCATISVPLDYSNPHGQKIKLALIKRPAKGAGNFVGTVIINPGGPGGSGIADIAGSSATYIYKGHFDQVSFDPRGIGLSEPFINCHTTAIDDNLNSANLTNFGPTSSPAYIAGLDQVIAATTAIWSICETNFSNVLPYLGTQNVARDIEQIRIALGGEKINYVGYSYGTFIGATYAMLFPNNIRTMVLDGALPVASTLYSQGVDSTQSYEATLDRMLSECDANPGCPLYDGTNNAAETVFNNLITTLNAAPIPASTPYGDLTALTPGWFITAVADGLASDWSGLTEGMLEALNGDGSALLAMGASSVGRSTDNTYDNSNEMYDIVQCIDFGDRPNATLVQALAYTVTTVDALPPGVIIPGPVALSPNMGPYGVRISMPLCIGTSIPILPPDPVPPIHSETTAPILVIGNITDPETPYIWGQSLSSGFINSVLLTWDGGFHTVFANDVSECIDDYTINYLVHAKLPPVGTVCPPVDPWA